MKSKTISQLMMMKPNPMPFSGEWRALMGRPEKQGSIIVYGPSGNGKTRFTLRLTKYLAEFEKVAYVAAEEGFGGTMLKAVREEGLNETGARIRIIENAPLTEVIQWLSRPRSPKIVVIDSVQMSGMTMNDFLAFNNMKGKLFIFISHEDPKDHKPAGAVARKIEYYSNVKIRVEGYRAMAKSRYGGGKPLDVWPEEAAKYWGETSK